MDGAAVFETLENFSRASNFFTAPAPGRIRITSAEQKASFHCPNAKVLQGCGACH